MVSLLRFLMITSDIIGRKNKDVERVFFRVKWLLVTVCLKLAAFFGLKGKNKRGYHHDPAWLSSLSYILAQKVVTVWWVDDSMHQRFPEAKSASKQWSFCNFLSLMGSKSCGQIIPPIIWQSRSLYVMPNLVLCSVSLLACPLPSKQSGYVILWINGMMTLKSPGIMTDQPPIWSGIHDSRILVSMVLYTSLDSQINVGTRCDVRILLILWSASISIT